MRPTNLVILGVFLLAVVSGASRVSADSGAVIVVGKIQPRERAVVASAVRSAARSVGRALVETQLTDAEVTKIVACVKSPQPWDCVAPLAGAKGIQRLIVVSVDPDRSPDGTPAFVLTEQVILQGAKASDQRPCSPCADEALTRLAFELTRRLIQEAMTSTGRTTLTIESIPPGAWITLDNANAGLTNRKLATFPGRHVIILQREGYETETRTVDAVEDQDTLVPVKLRRKGGSVVGGGGGGRRYLVPGIVAGAGVVAVGAGAVAIAYGTQDGTDDLYRYKRLAPVGLGTAALGVAALGVGGYLLWKGSRSPAPTVSVTAGGAVLGWAGTFR